MKRTLQRGNLTLEYEFTPKRVKNINLRVRGDGSVAVSAPRWVGKAQVEAFLLERWDWLQAAQNRTKQRQQTDFGWRQCSTCWGSRWLWNTKPEPRPQFCCKMMC